MLAEEQRSSVALNRASCHDRLKEAHAFLSSAVCYRKGLCPVSPPRHRGAPSEIWSVGGGAAPARLRQVDLQFTAGAWLLCCLFVVLTGRHRQ